MAQMNGGRNKFLWILAVVACLLLFYALGLGTILAKSPTNDEPAHLLRGALLRQTGDLQYQTGHAPLSHRLMGLFITSQPGFPQVEQLSSWSSGERLDIAAELLWASGLQVEKFLFLGRLPILWLGLLLGAAIASWAYSWLGRIPMLLSLLIFSGAPNIIAGSTLATTDLAVAAMYFATIYFWWRYWQSRANVWWLATAVFLGFALATKLTAVLLLPVLFLLALLFVWRGRFTWQPLWRWVGLLPLSFLTLWLVYGLELGGLAGFPLRLPAASYLVSWQTVLNHVSSGHQAFLLGELSNEGWWYYFPLTFLIKTPVVILLLLLFAAAVVITRKKLWLTTVFLLLPVFALFAAAMTSGLNIGYRHILPASPFLIVLLGASWFFFRRWTAARVLLIAALIWYLFSAIRQQPDHLAYFNELVGGTGQGFYYLGDSNLDWGQDINSLAEKIAGAEDNWYVAYAGVGVPGYYQIPEDSLINMADAYNGFYRANPAPGIYAISANNLQGNIPDADYFDWFRRQEPVDNLGGSILIYDVPAMAEGAWLAFCLDPGPILSIPDAERMIGQSGLRTITFDCRQSWVMPDPEQPGWYILPQDDRGWFKDILDPGVRERLQLVYRHRSSADWPSFDIYYWSGGGVQVPLEDPQLSAGLKSGETVALPAAPNDLLSLAGYVVDRDTWYTSWQILDSTSAPLSIQAHFFQDETALPMVADSLGYSSDQWQPGDIFIQRYNLVGNPGVQYLATGVYNFQSLEFLGESYLLGNR